MKKILFALLSCVTLCFSAYAADTGYLQQLTEISERAGGSHSWAAKALKYLSVDADVLNTALQAHFPDKTNYGNALAAYHAAVKANNGSGIMPKQMWDVCAAGGMDIKSAEGKQKCNDFAKVLATGFERRCLNGNHSGCYSEFKWVNVTVRQAINIAKVFTKQRWGTKFLACSDVVKQSGNDDYIACKNMLDSGSNSYIEFQFDDVYESVDADVVAGMKKAICIIVTGKDTCFAAENCPTVDKVARELGYSASVKNGVCQISENSITDASQLINEYKDKIDNFVFSSSKDQTEIQAMGSLDETIKQYCAVKLAPTQITSFSCDKSHRRWIRGTFEDNEDVLTCRINGKRVDFVFDDLTQANVLWSQKKKIEGSLQGLGCRAMGGIFDGEHCADLSEDMCKQVAKANLKDCPTCKQAYWDSSKKICMLPASKTAANVKTAINVATKTGVAAVTLVAVVASGGTALAIVAGSVATAAAVVSDGAKIVMDNDASDWVVEMNQIQTPEQARKFLEKHLSEIMGTKSLGASRINGVSEMLVGVINKAPDSMFEEIAAGCTTENGEFNNTLPKCALNPANGNNTLQKVINTADTIHFIAGVVMAVEGLRQVATTIAQRASVVSRAKVVDNLKGANKLVYLNPNGTQGTIVANSVLGGSNTAIVAESGLKVGEVVGLTTTGQIVQMAGHGMNVASIAGGVANAAVAFSDENLANVQIPGRNNTTPGGDTNPPKDGNPGGGNVPGDIDLDEVVVTAPKVERKIKGLDVGDTTPKIPEFTATSPTKKPSESTTPVVTPTVTPEQETPVPVVTPTVTTVPVSVAPIEPLKNVEPVKTEKKRNTAAIAIGSVLAVGATGGLVGGLVAKNKRDERREANKLTTVPVATPFVGAGNQLTNEMNALLGTAGGVLGYVNGKELKLIPLPTVVNTYSTIVQINVRAVVVVDYNGYKLPYYVEPTAGSWRPLLGIGQMGGWFNTYPSDTGITTIDSITNTLNQILAPANVSKFVGGAAGASFPVAAPAAYQIINAEFPNGVVQTYNGTFTPADQALYNSNYNKMKNAL